MVMRYPCWPWMEPAHFVGHMEPAHYVGHINDLENLYKAIREHQDKIDEAFDNVSRQIGFVVLTSIPLKVTVGDDGKVTGIEMGAENMKGTIFNSVPDAMKTALKKAPKLTKGEYDIVVFWKAGLEAAMAASAANLPDILGEPAHHGFRVSDRIAEEMQQLQSPFYSKNIRANPDALLARLRHEPAHFSGAFFDPHPDPWKMGAIVSAIDRVYPEMKIGARLAGSASRQAAAAQAAAAALGPWSEPAQFQIGPGYLSQSATNPVLTELAAVLRKYGY